MLPQLEFQLFENSLTVSDFSWSTLTSQNILNCSNPDQRIFHHIFLNLSAPANFYWNCANWVNPCQFLRFGKKEIRESSRKFTRLWIHTSKLSTHVSMHGWMEPWVGNGYKICRTTMSGNRIFRRRIEGWIGEPKKRSDYL